MYGIDFGTSNSVVTTQEGGRSRILELEEGGVLPSLLYFERNRGPSVGKRAMEDYAFALERFRGEGNLYASFRFFQAIKLALKDEYFTGTRLFGELLKPEALAGIFLRELKRRADEAQVRRESRLVLGRPVVLSPDPETDRLLEGRFKAAALSAGFEEVSFVFEPVAAMVSLLGQGRGGGLVLVFDFGGGTLDICLAKVGADSIEILATSGANLGGYLLNEDLSRARIVRHFGAEGKFRSMTGKLLDMPSWLTKQVASFYALPLADLTATRRAVRELVYEARPEDKPKLRGLGEFLDRNLAFSLFREIDEAKIGLSSRESAEIAFAVPPHLAFRESIARGDFEGLVAPRVEAARTLVLGTLENAGVEAGEIARIVRVGGSSRVPAFVAMLESLFPGRVEEGEVFTSIASGLLPAAERGLAV